MAPAQKATQCVAFSHVRKCDVKLFKILQVGNRKAFSEIRCKRFGKLLNQPFSINSPLSTLLFFLDNSLAEQLLRKISETSEKVSARGDQAVMVVSPAIRRQFAQLVRQHIEDLNVLAFTELPDSRKIEVVATISGEAG